MFTIVTVVTVQNMNNKGGTQRYTALGVGLPTHRVTAADCAGQRALLVRRLAQWRVLRNPLHE